MGVNEIHLILSIIGGSIGLILATASAMCLLFYTKSQTDKKLNELREEVEGMSKKRFERLDDDLKELKATVNEEIIEIRDVVSEFKLINQKERSEVKDELHEKLDDTKTALEEAMKQFINTITEIKQADKEMAVQFITLVNAVKDELKNDYTTRYNELLTMINTKANETDFNRLEQKFDKTFETITELKTIVQMGLDKDKK